MGSLELKVLLLRKRVFVCILADQSVIEIEVESAAQVLGVDEFEVL